MADTHGAQRLVTLSEVRALLEREQGTRAELSYEQKLAMDHAQHFAKLAPDRAQALVEKLLALGGRVTEYYAFRIADILPSHPDDVRAIFARDRSVPDNDEIEKVLAVVREFA
ncbi:MAG TPA: RNA polymerase Rpb4 family protein [Candidatus Thermoplasmatota archaeon]|nr:RNA polymerase Rpb4 family protein [Candidatus Thermoplasmatota archaeon]